MMQEEHGNDGILTLPILILSRLDQNRPSDEEDTLPILVHLRPRAQDHP